MSSSTTAVASPVFMDTTTTQFGNLSLKSNAPSGDIGQPPLIIESFKIMDIFSQLYNTKDYNSIDRLLNSGRVNINSQNSDGLSLLQLAVLDNNVVYAQYLLLKGANPNISDINQCTPLHTASSMGNINMQQVLFQAGAAINSQDQDGETPAHYSIREQKHASLLFLIKNGANVNAANEDQETLLHLACQLGDFSSVYLLVENGANIKATENDGLTAIQEAKENGHNQIVDYLLQTARKQQPPQQQTTSFDQIPFNSYNDLYFGSTNNNNTSHSYFNINKV